MPAKCDVWMWKIEKELCVIADDTSVCFRVEDLPNFFQIMTMTGWRGLLN